MFRKKIGNMVELYIDDMVVKSKEDQRHVGDLAGIFEVLRRHKLCLNADKCVFGVEAGKYLRYMITHRGIIVNPDEISTIEQLKPLSSPKKVQVLTEMLATLHRFVSKSAN